MQCGERSGGDRPFSLGGPLSRTPIGLPPTGTFQNRFSGEAAELSSDELESPQYLEQSHQI
jgi:hypothetical protein